MTTVRRALLLALAAAAAASALSTAVMSPSDARAGGALRILAPDLAPVTPYGLVVSGGVADGKQFAQLSFASAAINIGDGPLVIRGVRAGVNQPEMTADQILVRADGTEERKAGVGALRYIVDRTHEHWHLLSFMTYELRRLSGYRLVRPDQKTGFCLGDRTNADPTTLLPGEPDDRVFNSNCGLEETGLLEIEEGISVGWRDTYQSWLDGQLIDITGLRAGRYVLVHRVNEDRTLEETEYANNASSVLLNLSWPRGRSAPPVVKILRRCPTTDRCLPR
jgi:Lysyl oxidase